MQRQEIGEFDFHRKSKLNASPSMRGNSAEIRVLYREIQRALSRSGRSESDAGAGIRSVSKSWSRSSARQAGRSERPFPVPKSTRTDPVLCADSKRARFQSPSDNES